MHAHAPTMMPECALPFPIDKNMQSQEYSHDLWFRKAGHSTLAVDVHAWRSQLGQLIQLNFHTNKHTYITHITHTFAPDRVRQELA